MKAWNVENFMVCFAAALQETRPTGLSS
jgi:hypothetical protein